MNFTHLQSAVAKQFQAMTTTGLFRVDIDGDSLWAAYLNSFPEGTNPIYKTRTEHDCSACRHFVKTVGGVVAIVNNEIVTIWDGTATGFPAAVLEAMGALVRFKPIKGLFLHSERSVGVANNHQLLADQTVKTWSHFFVNLPQSVVLSGEAIGPKMSDSQAAHDVIARGLAELPIAVIDTVLDLIAQNSLYRGEEHAPALTAFRKLAAEYLTVDAAKRDCFVWSHLSVGAGRIRNTVIGSLLVDLAADVDLEIAVKSFESKVAPTNYKRPTALVTKAMVKKAQETVDSLGLGSALERRYAVIEDITINNVLFADRTAKKAMSVFDTISASVAENPKSLDRVEEVSIDAFLANVLPRAESLEVMVENRHTPNLVSLIAPSDPTAKGLFKWPNNFSWSYAGEVADSIKERVAAAGGNVTGDFRASLSWFNYDDLDLHLVEPSGYQIYFGTRKSSNGQGSLDVDMNAGSGTTRKPVENIVFPKRSGMPTGTYRLFVENYLKREAADVGFDVEMEFDGTVYSFSYPKMLATKEKVDVCTFEHSTSGLRIIKSLPSSQSTKTAWSIPTQTFHRVNVVMLSPNHWDEKAIGNRHFFFMLDGCANEGKARGFFNEFLSEELTPHRKVLEVVGAKMRTDESARQLSGLGFSSTQRNHLFCRVKGAFTRTVKIVF